MSLASALNSARSGLSYTSRWAQTTSTNISNANTLGYARRTPQLATSTMGDPVITGISRAVDASLDRMYRVEAGRTGRQDALAQVLSVHTDVLGDTESTDSMLARLTDFRNSLGLLSLTPADSASQRAAVTDAQDLAGALNRANEGLVQARRVAQSGVEQDVAAVNKSLAQIAELNRRIGQEQPGSDLQLSLQDQMTQALDDLAPVIDFTLRTTQSGEVELFTSGGAPLLESNAPALLSYDAATRSLTAGDVEITPGVDGVRGLSEGTLAGKLGFLTSEAPAMQHQLDEVARALIDGFQSVEQANGGTVGLFTDAGGALGATYAPGLAGRIAVNDAVLPEEGGALWRIRDGMAAAVPGTAGDATIVNQMAAMLDAPMSFDAAAGLGEIGTLSSYMSTLIASQQTARSEAETARDTFSAGAEAVQSRRMGFMGVNVDDELQQLLQIEQSYAANSQVLRVVSQMLDTLLESF